MCLPAEACGDANIFPRQSLVRVLVALPTVGSHLLPAQSVGFAVAILNAADQQSQPVRIGV